MKRPSDQAKLLFLGLLKTVSALAVEPRGSGAAVAAASSVATASWHEQALRAAAARQRGGAQRHAAVATATTTAPSCVGQQQQQDTPAVVTSSLPALTLRLARRTDVPSIQRCNLATLPENYNSQFYVQHMRTWPDLALVVVDESSSSSSSSSSNSGFGCFPSSAQQQPSNVVAYVLGKVEERREPVLPNPDEAYANDTTHWLDSASTANTPRYQTVEYGHVTSLAVCHEYRRQGLARQLMEQLHYQLQNYSGANQVGLHVRQSNLAACRLYQTFGYRQAQRIPTYYQDGEDAYYMLKTLKEKGFAEQQQQQSQARRSQRRPFQTQTGLFSAWRQPQHFAYHHPRQQQQQQSSSSSCAAARSNDLTLPRPVGIAVAEQQQQQQQDASQQFGSDEQPELLTGTY